MSGTLITYETQFTVLRTSRSEYQPQPVASFAKLSQSETYVALWKPSTVKYSILWTPVPNPLP